MNSSKLLCGVKEAQIVRKRGAQRPRGEYWLWKVAENRKSMMRRRGLRKGKGEGFVVDGDGWGREVSVVDRGLGGR